VEVFRASRSSFIIFVQYTEKAALVRRPFA
jgi:hypothetical protein